MNSDSDGDGLIDGSDGLSDGRELELGLLIRTVMVTVLPMGRMIVIY